MTKSEVTSAILDTIDHVIEAARNPLPHMAIGEVRQAIAILQKLDAQLSADDPYEATLYDRTGKMVGVQA